MSLLQILIRSRHRFAGAAPPLAKDLLNRAEAPAATAAGQLVARLNEGFVECV
jgi:hypothetical protein